MPLRYVRVLTAAEQAELTELYKSSPVAAVVRRSHAILLSADGWAIPQIAALNSEPSDHPSLPRPL